MTISNVNQNLSALQGLSLNTDNLANKDVSINLMMAALQLELSKSNKENAAVRIEMIRNQQNQAAEIADLINDLRNLKSKEDYKGLDAMPDTVAGLNKYGINIPEKLNSDKVDLMIQSLQTIQDQTGTDIQQQMVYVQDQIGQYNSYSQGASTAITKANEILSTIVSAR